MKKILCAVCPLILLVAGIFCFSGCTSNPEPEEPSEAESIVAEVETN